MFKKFLRRINEAENRRDAWDNVFYAKDGISIAYQYGKLTEEEYEMLVAIISNMA